jgi:dTMP kinase
MEVLSNFVVFEGGDGSGTTTQLEMLRRRFSAPASSLARFWSTFEPTDGPIGRLIRSGLRAETSLLPDTMAYLFSADRNEHLHAKGGIIEHAANGELVISDRYVLSSLVYQGIVCGDSLPKLLNNDFPAPELLFFFDIDPQIALKRMENRPVQEIYEYLDFQIMVQQRYKTLLPYYADNGAKVAVIDASKPAEAVAEEVWTELQKMPIFKIGNRE